MNWTTIKAHLPNLNWKYTKKGNIAFMKHLGGGLAPTCQVVGFMAISFLLVTSISADEQVIYPDICSAQDTHCYFERYGNFKLPRIEPIQASKIRFFFFFI